MSTRFSLNNGQVVELVMPNEQAKRLIRTCFRGPNCRQAGNFFAWRNFRDFLEDKELRDLLCYEFERILENPSVNSKHRIEIEFSGKVGWDSVMSGEDLLDEDVASAKIGRLNKRAFALFLPVGQIEAPKTEVVTMVLTMKQNRIWKFIIGTLYPGPDCGELRGDMTKRHNLYWLDWANPGEK
jgi:hypothetical protein